MKVKSVKKLKEKKGKKNQVAKKEKMSVPKKAEAKADIPKISVPKISAIVKDGLNAKPPLTYEEILKNVLKHHPESKFNKLHYGWYKHKLGLNKP